MAQTPTKNETNTNKIIEKQQLNPQVKLLKIYAPTISQKAQPGQFVILKTHVNSERIPLTLTCWDKYDGTITLIFQEVGYSTTELGKLEVGERIENLAGPLGKPSEIEKSGKVAVVCGGVGTAVAYPVAKALKEAKKLRREHHGRTKQRPLHINPRDDFSLRRNLLLNR